MEGTPRLLSYGRAHTHKDLKGSCQGREQDKNEVKFQQGRVSVLQAERYFEGYTIYTI